ncbi:MAG: hypothetical protein JXA54_14795 [Candidatus Heimdallarchaeota archaeon]|nr:hypothetical protein [Candidatus Heimdallarchaeota archaeon]
MSRFKLPIIKDKRAQIGLRKQIISIFSIDVNEMGPVVESIASPYDSCCLFNEREISILFSVINMLEIKEMIIGELKLIFEIFDSIMDDGRPAKKVIVTVCGDEANSGQVRATVRNMIHSSETAIKNLENILER